MKKYNMDQTERDLLRSVENNEWVSIGNKKQEFKKYAEIAKNSLKKDKRINIRINRNDIESIQIKAIEDGIPYQTLISSILHKYASGRLIEKV